LEHAVKLDTFKTNMIITLKERKKIAEVKGQLR